MAQARTTPPQSDERSVGRLVADVTTDLSTLVRGEIELAKLEMKQAATQAVAGSVMFVVAGTFAFFALIMLLASAAYGLVALGVPRALAFLIVAVVLLILGGLLGFAGSRKVKQLRGPERTIENSRATMRALRPNR